MITEDVRKEIIRKRGILEKVKEELKIKFVGLDLVIDEVIEQVRAWYLFPEGQSRPTIVNLWGMTGVGKTSLVESLFDLLDISERLHKFDIGEYTDGDEKIQHSFTQIENPNNNPLGLILDEFQLGRTLNEIGDGVDKKSLRAVWDLLDTGKIESYRYSFYFSEIFMLHSRLKEVYSKDDIETRDGIIVKNGQNHASIFYERETKFYSYEESIKVLNSESETEEDEFGDKDDKKLEIHWLVPRHFFYKILSFWESRFINNLELNNFLNKLSVKQTLDFLEETFSKLLQPKVYDFSNSIIFVIGNLDSVYHMSDNSNPDVDADSFHETSLKITQTDIKDSLRSMYRNEQIARLGNNHIIYPAFSRDTFKKLITLELGKITKNISEKFNMEIVFEKSVNEVVYKEGVFPTQGSRPVFTTINSIINSYVGKIVSLSIERNIINETEKIIWTSTNKKHTFEFVKGEEKLLTKSYPLNLKVESLRESKNDSTQAMVAVHESGHAIVMMMTMNVVPNYVRSRTANSYAGFCSMETPEIITKKNLEDQIAFTSGGRAAEALIFGEEMISEGACSDIEIITKTAMKMVKRLGMNAENDLMVFSRTEHKNDKVANFKTSDVNDQARALVKKQYLRAKNILEREKVLLLKMSEYLTENTLIEKEEIKNLFNKHAVKKVEFKNVKDYHSYKSILFDQIKKIL